MPDLIHASDEIMSALEASLPEQVHPTLREVVQALYLHLVEEPELIASLGLTRLAEIAVGQIDRVAMEVGGATFYMPKGVGCKLSARDREIGERFNGRNGHELAREYRISDVRVAQIYKKWRQAEFAKRQGALILD